MPSMAVDQLDVSIYAIVKDGPLRFTGLGVGQGEVTCDEWRDGYQLLLAAAALREVAAAGSAEMDALFERDIAEVGVRHV